MRAHSKNGEKRMKIKNMMRLVAAAVFTGVIAAPLAISSAGCGKSQCDTLKDACNACTGTAGKAGGQAGCNTIVSAGNDDLCKVANDSGSYAATGAACK